MEQINRRFIDYKNKYEVSIKLVWDLGENTKDVRKVVRFNPVSAYVGKFKQSVIRVDSMYVKTALDPSVNSMDDTATDTYGQMKNNITTGTFNLLSSLPQPNKLRSSMGNVYSGAIAEYNISPDMTGTMILGQVPSECMVIDPSYNGGQQVASIVDDGFGVKIQNRNVYNGGYTDGDVDINTNFSANKNYGGRGIGDGILTSNPFGQALDFRVSNGNGEGLVDAVAKIGVEINLTIQLIDPLEPELTPSEFRF